jgi:eukaryotic-like serine/threonine-protein kinase
LTSPTANETAPMDVPQVGDVIAGRYVVERVLGQGGMGVVLAARHQQLGELVAIKLLRPTATKGADANARLLREARATHIIKSEHVVRVMDAGTLDSGAPYIMMEYLDGSDLGDVLRSRGPLPIPEAVDYVLQACEAIAEAHARGIIHRDLKPSNLLLTQRADGSSLIKVLDFGISKAVATGDATGSGSQPPESLTATHAVFGSPAYMSPEQVRSAKRVDERTDVWALGVVLHELLAGVTPFAAESVPAILAAVVADAPPSLRAARPEVPEGLARTVTWCLVKDVNARCQSVADLAAALAVYAPAESGPSISRIARLAQTTGPQMRRSGSFAPPVAVAAQAAAETVKAVTTSHGDSIRPRSGSRGPALWTLAVAAVAVAGAAVIYVARGSRPPPPATSVGLVAPAPPPAAISAPISLPPSESTQVEAPETSPSVSASTSSRPRAPAAVPAAAPAPHASASARNAASATPPPPAPPSEDHALDGR